MNPRPARRFIRACIRVVNGLGHRRQMVINRTATSGVSSNDFWGYRSFTNRIGSSACSISIAISGDGREAGAGTNATDPNLEPFRKLGHKLIYYHGAADPLIPAQNGIDYFETVVKAQKGWKNPAIFPRLPGAGNYHCGGGPGAWDSAVRCRGERGGGCGS